MASYGTNRNHHQNNNNGSGNNNSGGGNGGGGANSLNVTNPNFRELAYVMRRPIEGRRSRGLRIKGSRWSTLVRRRSSISSGPGPGTTAGFVVGYSNNNGSNGNGESSKPADFVCYAESDDDDDDDEYENLEGLAAFPSSSSSSTSTTSTSPSSNSNSNSSAGASEQISCNFSDCLMNRELGLHESGFQAMRMTSEYGTRHMLTNAMLKEYPLTLPNKNKIFCSQWLSHRQVVFGTKWNELMVYDVNTRHLEEIPILQSSENSIAPHEEYGIHAIEINPSRTLLATGAKNTNDLAVYRLPTLDPIAVGESAHSDWIFGMTWIDDQFLVSGSRDGSLALWKVTDRMVEEATESEIPSFMYTNPLVKKRCKSADIVRAVSYNRRKEEFVAISMNGYIHCFDANTFKQVMSKKLPHCLENVCLATDEDATMYAVGSKGSADLLDARTLQPVRRVPSRNNGCGIRSVSFKGNILTFGTGAGVILFWDLRAGKFLESTMNSNRAVSLKASKGWVLHDQHMPNNDGSRYSPSIYTHCYDVSGTRLFAAGGPLENKQTGNYIAVFQ